MVLKQSSRGLASSGSSLYTPNIYTFMRVYVQAYIYNKMYVVFLNAYGYMFIVVFVRLHGTCISPLGYMSCSNGSRPFQQNPVELKNESEPQQQFQLGLLQLAL
eukprot:scaffold8901_cov31-Prasinocladus_malaysianus.AAC.1